MKKVLSLILAAVLLTALAVPAFAAQPRWANVSSISPSLRLASDTYSSTVTGQSGTTKIVGQLILFERDPYGDYTEVARTGRTTVNSSSATFSGSYELQSGTSYRLLTMADVTCGGVTESVSYNHDQSL